MIEEILEKKSKSRIGVSLGPCSDETKLKIGKANKEVWKNMSIEKKQRISESKSGNKNPMFGKQTHNSKSVIINGIKYNSTIKAAKAIGVVQQTISNRCKSVNFPNYNFAVQE